MQSATQHHRPDQSPSVPTDVTSKGGKLVYVYLATVVEARIEQIATALGLKHLELLPALASLQRAGYVERDGDTCRIAN